MDFPGSENRERYRNALARLRENDGLRRLRHLRAEGNRIVCGGVKLVPANTWHAGPGYRMRNNPSPVML